MLLVVITLRLQLLLMSLCLNICLYVFWGQWLPIERPSFSCLGLVECNLLISCSSRFVK